MTFFKNSFITFTILTVAIWVMPVITQPDISVARNSCRLLLESVKKFTGSNSDKFKSYIMNLAGTHLQLNTWTYDLATASGVEGTFSGNEYKIIWQLFRDRKNSGKDIVTFCDSKKIAYFNGCFLNMQT